MYRRITSILLFALFMAGVSAPFAFASTGTIVAPYQYAWDDNGGYINWNAATASSSVIVSDTGLTGYIWSAGFGWINLAPTEGGVTNNAGVLSGWAWGQNTGWIDFTGVTIDSNGIFHGHTVAQATFGTMTFDCTYCEVMSTWKAPYVAPPSPPVVGGNNGSPSGPLSFGYQASTSASNSNPSTSTSSTPVTLPPSLIPTTPPPIAEPTNKPPTKVTRPTYYTTSTNSQASQTQVTPSSAMASTSPESTTLLVESATMPSTVSPVATYPATANSPQPTPTTPAAPLTPACSWLTCWVQGIWHFFTSIF